MNNVVALRKEPEEHLSGTARCSACRHEWVAVAPVGVDWLECPACTLMKGRYLHPALPPSGSEMWECGCGCDVFRVTRDSAYCINCGTEQRF